MISILRLKLEWTITSALNSDQHDVNYRMFERAYRTLDPNMRKLVADRLLIVLNKISAPDRGRVKIVCDNSGYLCDLSASEIEGPYTRVMNPHLYPSYGVSPHEQRLSGIALCKPFWRLPIFHSNTRILDQASVILTGLLEIRQVLDPPCTKYPGGFGRLETDNAIFDTNTNVCYSKVTHHPPSTEPPLTCPNTQMVYSPMNLAIPPMRLPDPFDQHDAPSIDINTAATADPQSFDGRPGDTQAANVGSGSSVATQPPSYLSNVPGSSFPDTQQPSPAMFRGGEEGVELDEDESDYDGALELDESDSENEDWAEDGEIRPVIGRRRRKQQQKSRPWRTYGKARRA
ncbi:MAG: hypothetical protein Q9160_001059 [Pyrenula sp. 1 TL-2023]